MGFWSVRKLGLSQSDLEHTLQGNGCLSETSLRKAYNLEKWVLYMAPMGVGDVLFFPDGAFICLSLCSPDLCDDLQLSWPLPLSFVLFLGCLSLICVLSYFYQVLLLFGNMRMCFVLCSVSYPSLSPVPGERDDRTAHTTVRSQRGLCLPLTELIPGGSSVCDAKVTATCLLKRELNTSSRSTTSLHLCIHTQICKNTHIDTNCPKIMPPGSWFCSFSRMVLDCLE